MAHLSSNEYSIFWSTDDITEEVKLDAPIFEEQQDNERPEDEGFTKKLMSSICYQYFDITTAEVIARLSSSMFPSPFANLTFEILLTKNDLFGPFWIGVTLAIIVGVTSDLAYTFFLLAPSLSKPWTSLGVFYAAYTFIFLYTWCLPTCLWLVLKWHSTSQVKYTLPTLYCIYGYAMAAYLPPALFWFLPVWWLKLVTSSVGVVISGVSICRNLRHAIREVDRFHYVVIHSLLFVINAFVGYILAFLFYPATVLSDRDVNVKTTLNTTVVLNYTLNASTLNNTINRIN